MVSDPLLCSIDELSYGSFRDWGLLPLRFKSCLGGGAILQARFTFQLDFETAYARALSHYSPMFCGNELLHLDRVESAGSSGSHDILW
ncbi:hypothetical protein PanWU01x14_289660 [Parasponia andersonii]|uniref:Uncharacterized protein n=1 Tax=Parasponia andersonii TaxID=3476 RepID=A0A2P5AY19_PARAD|nr:hypothetical protein PanWU01x14_289660 [Parasponia andersonii]